MTCDLTGTCGVCAGKGCGASNGTGTITIVED